MSLLPAEADELTRLIGEQFPGIPVLAAECQDRRGV